MLLLVAQRLLYCYAVRCYCSGAVGALKNQRKLWLYMIHNYMNKTIIAPLVYCDLCQPCSARKEQSVELGADDGGGGGAVSYLKA